MQAIVPFVLLEIVIGNSTLIGVLVLLFKDPLMLIKEAFWGKSVNQKIWVLFILIC